MDWNTIADYLRSICCKDRRKDGICEHDACQHSMALADWCEDNNGDLCIDDVIAKLSRTRCYKFTKTGCDHPGCHRVNDMLTWVLEQTTSPVS